MFAQRFGLDLSSFDTDSKRLPSEPSFNTVGTLLAAECWLLLDAPECRGQDRRESR